MSYTWPETLTFGESLEVSRRSTSALTVVCGSVTAEASSAASARPVASAARCRKLGSGEKAGPALRVVHDRDFEEPVSRDLPAEQLLGEEGQDLGLGHALASGQDLTVLAGVLVAAAT